MSSKDGDLPVPGTATQQTASLIMDVDLDGDNDFVIASRRSGASIVWYERHAGGWIRHPIENDTLNIEAGGTRWDIDGDGDLDVVMGGDSNSNQVWWWENTRPPNPDPGDPWKDNPWTRRLIKNGRSNKHHDQIFGDFAEDPEGPDDEEPVFWNQRAKKLFLAKVPDKPTETSAPWTCTSIYSWSEGSDHEGLAKADIDGDGKVDIVGGGRWFKHNGGTSYTAHIIDNAQTFGRAAAGQLKPGGPAEVVFGPGDTAATLKWYELVGSQWTGSEWVGGQWEPHTLVATVDHGHSLQVADVNGDGNLDIFCAEMRLHAANPDAKMWVLYGDGKGGFSASETSIVATGYGNHESKVGDLDGDGDVDILGKPYDWDTPRVDVWLSGLVPSSSLLLSPDWNLVTLRMEPLPDAEAALDEIASQEGDATEIYRWIDGSDTWDGHARGRPYGLFALELGRGYFLRAPVSSTWRRTGTPPAGPVPIPLGAERSLIGLPNLPYAMTASDLLAEASAQGGGCTEICRWDRTTSSWEIFDDGMSGPGFELTDDEGYFVRCANTITYTPGSGSAQQMSSFQFAPEEPLALRPEPDPEITDVLITIRRDVALTITWRTSQPSTGWVEHGDSPDLGRMAHDALGKGAVSMVHDVTVTGLEPETKHSFRVHSGDAVDDNEGTPYQVTTKKTELPPAPYLAYGQVERTLGTPAVGALARAWLTDGTGQSEPLSALVDGYGEWSMSLPVTLCGELQLELQFIGPEGNEAELVQPLCEVRPVPTQVLSREDKIDLYLPLVLRSSPQRRSQ